MQDTVMEAENGTWKEWSPSLNSMLPLQAHPAARVEHSTRRKMNELRTATPHQLRTRCSRLYAVVGPILLCSSPSRTLSIKAAQEDRQSGQGRSLEAARTASTARAERDKILYLGVAPGCERASDRRGRRGVGVLAFPFTRGR